MRSRDWSRIHKRDIQWAAKVKKPKRFPVEFKPFPSINSSGYNPHAIRAMKLKKGGNRADAVLRRFD